MYACVAAMSFHWVTSGVSEQLAKAGARHRVYHGLHLELFSKCGRKRYEVQRNGKSTFLMQPEIRNLPAQI